MLRCVVLVCKRSHEKEEKASLRKVWLPENESFKSKDLAAFSRHMFDGGVGALIHRVQWDRGMNLTQIAMVYLRYLERHYKNPIVLFDRYNKTSTKAQTHIR